MIDGEAKAYELSECCKVYWHGKQTPEKANLEFLIGLRNKIEHRGSPVIDLAVTGECLAALTNFEDILVQEFGKEYSLNAQLAIAMQLTRTSQEAQINALKALQSENYQLIKQYIDKYRDNLDDEILESQNYRISVFLIPKIKNHAKSADLCIEFINSVQLSDEDLEKYEQVIAFIKKVDGGYKLKPHKVIGLVSQKFGTSFSMHMHTNAWKYYKARPKEKNDKYKGDYCGWVDGFDGYLYTNKWVDFLLDKLSQKEEWEKVYSYKDSSKM